MNGFQIAIIALYFIHLLIVSNKHGQPKTGNYDFFTSLISSSVSLALMYGAGTFDNR